MLHVKRNLNMHQMAKKNLSFLNMYASDFQIIGLSETFLILSKPILIP